MTLNNNKKKNIKQSGNYASDNYAYATAIIVQ